MKKIVSVFCLMAVGALMADVTPAMVSLVSPLQVPYRSYDVAGLRLSLIYGECQDFAGLDIGLIGNAHKDFTGLAVGLANIAGERLYGVQVGLMNWNSHPDSTPGRRSAGIQVGLLNYADAFCGFQDGIINVSSGSFLGLQWGLVNYAHDMESLQCGNYFVFGVNMVGDTMSGCQIGLVNFTDRSDCGWQIGLLNLANRVDCGYQIGLVNFANGVDNGWQIGLGNIIVYNGWLPVLPIINGNF